MDVLGEGRQRQGAEGRRRGDLPTIRLQPSDDGSHMYVSTLSPIRIPLHPGAPLFYPFFNFSPLSPRAAQVKVCLSSLPLCSLSLQIPH